MEFWVIKSLEFWQIRPGESFKVSSRLSVKTHSSFCCNNTSYIIYIIHCLHVESTYMERFTTKNHIKEIESMDQKHKCILPLLNVLLTSEI
jgi:hypothetical protein